MFFNKKLFDLDDLFDDIFDFDDWFKFGRKRKKRKIAKKGCQSVVGCLTVLFAAGVLIAICGVAALFAVNRTFLPNISLPSVPSISIPADIPITTSDVETSAELRDAIFVELVEDSRVTSQIGDPLPLLDSDLNTTSTQSLGNSEEIQLDFEGSVFGSGGSLAIAGQATQFGNQVTLTELLVTTESEEVIDLLTAVGR
ncbi:MAG: hypothetical protein AAF633_10250 [Chloroflexota bacterium]